MDWVQMLGFLAASLMFSTFYMEKMIPLRIVGMVSNVTFILYAGIGHIWPLFVLHILLLPMNFFRLIQMIKLIKDVHRASDQDVSFDFLVPYMKKNIFKKNTVIFHKNDKADQIYLLKSGTLAVDELGILISPGEIIGEMGVFSREKKRLATLRCNTDVELLSMTDKEIKQLYYQNPKFGFYLIQLLLKRLTLDDLKGLGSPSHDIREQDESVEKAHDNHNKFTSTFQ